MLRVPVLTALRRRHRAPYRGQVHDAMLDEDAASISAGQKQLLTIARAFLARLRRGRTSFVLAHRLSTIGNADTIVVMNEGRIVEQGSQPAKPAEMRVS